MRFSVNQLRSRTVVGHLRVALWLRDEVDTEVDAYQWPSGLPAVQIRLLGFSLVISRRRLLVRTHQIVDRQRPQRYLVTVL